MKYHYLRAAECQLRWLDWTESQDCVDFFAKIEMQRANVVEGPLQANGDPQAYAVPRQFDRNIERQVYEDIERGAEAVVRDPVYRREIAHSARRHLAVREGVGTPESRAALNDAIRALGKRPWPL